MKDDAIVTADLVLRQTELWKMNIIQTLVVSCGQASFRLISQRTASHSVTSATAALYKWTCSKLFSISESV